MGVRARRTNLLRPSGSLAKESTMAPKPRMRQTRNVMLRVSAPRSKSLGARLTLRKVFCGKRFLRRSSFFVRSRASLPNNTLSPPQALRRRLSNQFHCETREAPLQTKLSAQRLMAHLRCSPLEQMREGAREDEDRSRRQHDGG